MSNNDNFVSTDEMQAPSGGFTAAAVLVPVFQKDNELHLVLTKRTQTVQHHKGQICFPGGVAEEYDGNLWRTALRETHEEVGLSPASIVHVCELAPLTTPTLFHITPYVGFIFNDVNFAPNPHEIDEIICVPVKHFFDKNHLRYETKTYFDKDYHVPHITFNQHEIWGATAKIILDFVGRWE